MDKDDIIGGLVVIGGLLKDLGFKSTVPMPSTEPEPDEEEAPPKEMDWADFFRGVRERAAQGEGQERPPAGHKEPTHDSNGPFTAPKMSATFTSASEVTDETVFTTGATRADHTSRRRRRRRQGRGQAKSAKTDKPSQPEEVHVEVEPPVRPSSATRSERSADGKSCTNAAVSSRERDLEREVADAQRVIGIQRELIDTLEKRLALASDPELAKAVERLEERVSRLESGGRHISLVGSRSERENNG
ncbi:MAG: hypothetical protein KC468_31560 [Myxococcales bacterium]|nr:hypothetical protein [Myxococcales bacterium]